MCSRKLAGNALEFLAVLAIALTVTSMARSAPTYRVLHAFTGGNDGGGLYAGLVLDNKGNVYGATSGGGAYGQGTAFELVSSPNGHWAETILHDFSLRSDGESPMGTLALDAAGNLYGATIIGGANDAGTVFELSPDPPSPGSWNFHVLYEAGSDVGLVLDSAGNLYGIGGPGLHKAGAVFELSPSAHGWTERVLYSFTGKNGDCCPSSALTFDAAGNLYATTKFGGIGDGTAYRIVRGNDGVWREQRLHNFSGGSDGKYPYDAGLVLDSEGNAYGTTLQGGGCNGGCGTVFKLTLGSHGHWAETILYNFNNAKDGADPAAALTFDKSGNLYGTTSGGGFGNGVVFKMTPQAGGNWNYSVLHRFTGKDGYSPQASVILDDKGNIYGTTTAGGADGAGVVFEITP